MSDTPQVPDPFPLDFDIEDGPCLVCKGKLAEDWICLECGADHFEGVMLLIGYGMPRKGAPPPSARCDLI
ncbi:hypothetical protein [Paracoccus haeundaensis]|jgi:hypothetical protein|uniref:Uncharacterized protein n=1 Tax=Paracoccus haeundaensis TaxID=225362 RepID=A0A5C4R4F6_9RHOB|nr:hypothetical protein [Paracoccus haeundaensis]TNH38795.1 hypothetical protein FHD67_13035 [Paracoccus haeundaensis]